MLKGGGPMTIAEVSARYDLSQDTLRYYERVGLIPPVTRTPSGLRDYRESDLRWVEFIKCMRGAGVSIEALVEYVALFRQGPSSIAARKALLVDQRRQIAGRIEELQAALQRLDKKLDGYEQRMLKIEENLYQSPD
jgi:DNA-binding transcriptional MerR regulator